MPNEVHVIEGPQGFALICAGDPNGAIRAPIGTLAIDNVTPTIWQNTNGVTTWVQVGGGGSSGFPVGPHDDGTSTEVITATGGELIASSTRDIGGDVAILTLDTSAATAPVAALETFGEAAGVASFHLHAVDTGPASRAILNTDGNSIDLIAGTGDPNTVVSAFEGSLFMQVDGPAVWQNTNGVTAWAKVASSFPVGPLDDATNTYEITATGSTLSATNTKDGTGELAAVGGIALAGSATEQLQATTGAHAATLGAAADTTEGRAALTIDGLQVHFLIGTGDPNGAVSAPIASLFFDHGSGNVYRNTNGTTAWTAM